MKKLAFLFLIAATVVACKKDDEDTARPVISSVKVNGTVSTEHEVNASETVTVEVYSTDNKELNQLKVEIHSADDGHSHTEGSTEEVLPPNIGVWSDSRIISLSGTSSTNTVEFAIPAAIAGHWHVEVLLIDKDGNEAIEYVTTLHVENSNLPTFAITATPAVTNYEIETVVGGTVVLTGTVADPDGLTDIHVELENEETGEVIFEQELIGVTGTSFDLGTINIGPIATAGHYHLHLHATDALNYMGEWAVDVHVE
jgi:hypothetical protein